MSISSIGNGASTVDYTEMRKKLAERMTERMMKDLDTDGDGAISKAELAEAKSAADAGKADPKASAASPSVDELFSAIDSGADGSITKDELLSFVQKSEPKGPPAGGPPPGAPPPSGPPPAGAKANGETEASSASTEEEQVKSRQAFAYQQLMALLQNLGVSTQAEGAGGATSVGG